MFPKNQKTWYQADLFEKNKSEIEASAFEREKLSFFTPKYQK